ncbi:elongation factor G [Nonomuraea gerenzanensis]|uniref:Ribosome protection-type tetracycline resistance related proteins n=1 Tax=Nonomuraea gerenzanensis TaxID=93944 RepID=A0A1M4EFP0_9ACTN|nr:TetM/TetW/TetO/TetS family tetracycline resistance ribosomal protection protein [Nonomuraea gerenzanensis]UBU09139.1 TetM/TetW/TetO/TetS family tetracycline resistance ribosomal protection protein [Nonomuraea gerenzanensis]SBO97526.1 Ribosome protection-type tetracycline resistance related proteins [Nonomuraea gerenzanensis]
MIKHVLNIGILAHVDAGKTSLTERLLFETGVIDRLGSVDGGDTQTDTGEIERRRGITIRAAVASFALGDLRVNLVDTPGHADFVAEVERALGVLDGAVLVLSAVEGVQPHTRVLMRTLRKLRLPTLIFVNKIDRAGAREHDLLADIRRRLSPSCVPLNTVDGLGSPAAVTRPVTDPYAVAEVLAERDDELLGLLVDGQTPEQGMVRAALARQCGEAVACPVLFGSAITGQGLPELLDGIAELFPAVPRVAVEGASATGTVFAVERAPSGEKVAFVRVRGGVLRVREPLTFFRGQRRSGGDGPRAGGGAGSGGAGRTADHAYEARLTALSVAGAPREAQAVAGDIVKIWGVPEIRVGDHLGEPGPANQAHFTPPSLETVVRPRIPGQEPRLHAALLAMTEQDPLIGTRALPGGGTSVLLYGEVQKEVIGETLAREFGVEAEFEPSRPVYFERPSGSGEAVEEIQRQGRNEFMATVGLRVEPAPAGSGVGYRLEVDLGSLPLAFHRAIEESVRLALREGPHGWPVTDVLVTLTRTGYSSPVTTAGDFRGRVPVVLARALKRAGTVVYEPCHRFEAEVPLEAFGPVTAQLAALGGEVRDARREGEGWVLEGKIPAAVVHEAERRLPGLSHGEGVWWSEAAGDRPLR